MFGSTRTDGIDEVRDLTRHGSPTARPDDRGEASPDADTEQERLLTALVDGAVRLITARLSRGEPARAVLAEVLSVVFGADIGDGHAGRACDDRRELVRRAGELDRIVAAALGIVASGHNQ